MKLAFFGGMFDPIHAGHLKCAEEAMSVFNLQKILFIPSASPPHKKSANASGQDRVAMLKLAIEGRQGFELSRVELERSETTYTIDTLKELITNQVSEPYFIIGADAFSEIASWKKSDELFGLTNFIAFSRAGYLGDGLIEKVLHGMLKKGYEARFKIENETKRGKEARYCNSPYKVYFLKSFLDETSSTKIKSLLKEGGDTRGMLPKKVKEYIVANKVY